MSKSGPRICIVGAGAIGGLLGARLAAYTNAHVSALARGATLKALLEHGWRLKEGEAWIGAPVQASDAASELRTQDVVILAVKGPALPTVASQLSPLVGPSTVVVPAMNGVPWWFCDHLPELARGPLQSVDPGGVVARTIAPDSIVGCVIQASVKAPEPGVSHHQMGRKILLGEPGGTSTLRVADLTGLLCDAGFDATPSTNIRGDIWYKLWGNLTINPVSALTGATADRVVDDPLVNAFCAAAMAEAAAVGTVIGCPIDQSPQDRLAMTRRLGSFKTSMLQDVELNHPLELDAIVGAVREIAQRVAVPTPSIDALFGLTRLLGTVRGIYP